MALTSLKSCVLVVQRCDLTTTFSQRYVFIYVIDILDELKNFRHYNGYTWSLFRWYSITGVFFGYLWFWFLCTL